VVSPEKDGDIVKALETDPALFEIIVERYQKRLLKMAQAITHDSEISEEVVHETFIKIFSKAKKYYTEIGGIPFYAWVSTILHNEIIDCLNRRKRRWAHVVTGDIFEHADLLSSNPEEEILLQLKIREAIKKLPPAEQIVIQEYYWKGVSLPALAKQYGVSRCTLWRIHRSAIQHLQTTLQEAS